MPPPTLREMSDAFHIQAGFFGGHSHRDLVLDQTRGVPWLLYEASDVRDATIMLALTLRRLKNDSPPIV